MSSACCPNVHRSKAYTACCVLLILATPVVSASPSTQPADQLVTLEQRAHDAAFQELIDEVMRLPLTTGRSVAGVLAPSPEADRALRRAILTEHERGRSRSSRDGGVEVDVWIPASRLSRILCDVIDQHLPNVIDQERTISDATGPAVVATGRVSDDLEPRSDRPGWWHCTARQVDLARRAAEIDLRRRLKDWTRALRLPGAQTLGQLFSEHPRFRDAVLRRLEALPLPEPNYEPTGVCQQRLKLSQPDMIQLLARAAIESAETIRVDFSTLMGAAFDDPVTIQGYSVAPPNIVSDFGPDTHADQGRPAWADEFLSARSIGNPPSGVADAQTRRELAAKAASIEAVRKLWIDIEKLPLPEGDTLSLRLKHDPALASELAAIDDAIFPLATPIYSDDDSATVNLGLRLETVWRIVRSLQQPASEKNEISRRAR